MMFFNIRIENGLAISYSWLKSIDTYMSIKNCVEIKRLKVLVVLKIKPAAYENPTVRDLYHYYLL